MQLTVYSRNLGVVSLGHYLVVTAPILLVLVQILGVQIGGFLQLLIVLSVRGYVCNLALVLTVADVSFSWDTVGRNILLGSTGFCFYLNLLHLILLDLSLLNLILLHLNLLHLNMLNLILLFMV